MLKPQRASVKSSLIALTISVLLLSGCQTRSGNCDLIPIASYDQAFKEKLNGEVSIMADDSASVRFIGDSIGLRDAVRACQGNAPGTGSIRHN